MNCWTETDERFLLELLAMDTVTPMETSRVCDLDRAQRAYAQHASQIGFEVIHFAPPPATTLAASDTPLSVHERAARMGSAFFESQPNMVVRLGSSRPVARTLLFNFHMDTVSDLETPTRDNGRLSGRGVADAKGLGVAVIAGVRQALRLCPNLTDRITILIQSVAGEEGGAMGVYGTKHLVNSGYSGRLNVVCEPTDFAYFDRTTTSMTARIEVRGEGSTDDEPMQGENATILLAAVTTLLTCELSPEIFQLGAKMCIAGLNTGTMHNRVYGSGALLLNFAYPSLTIAAEIERLTAAAFQKAVTHFQREYAQYAVARAAAAAAPEICTLTWLKRGLPVLSNRDTEMENLFKRVGIAHHDEASQASPFTCDAMWLQGPGRFTVVLGPGNLGKNKTHAPGEFLDREDLERYAQDLSAIIVAFAEHPG